MSATEPTSKFYDDLETYRRHIIGVLGPGACEAQRLARNPQLDDYDYGVWWRDESGNVYRVSWQDDTDELYLVRLSGPHRSVVTGEGGQIIAESTTAGQASGAVEVLAVIPAYEGGGRDGLRPPHRDDTVEKILSNWPDRCERPLAVAWLRQRIAWAVQLGLARYP